MTRLCALLLLAAAVGLAPAVAVAQAEPPGSRETDAREAFDEGVRASQASRWKDAEAHFATAASLAPNPNVLFNLAVARYKLKRYPEALETLEQLGGLPNVKEVRRAAARRLRVRVHAEVARIVVQVEPAEAVLLLDGKPLAAGQPIVVDIGPHTLQASHQGFEPMESAFEGRLGELSSVDLKLRPLSVAAEITPPTRPPQPVAEPPLAGRKVRAERAEKPAKPWAWMAGAAAAAGLTGVGAWMWHDRQSAVDLCEDPPDTPCSGASDSRVRKERNAWIATAAVAAAASLGFGVTTVWRWPRGVVSSTTACAVVRAGTVCAFGAHF